MMSKTKELIGRAEKMETNFAPNEIIKIENCDGVVCISKYSFESHKAEKIQTICTLDDIEVDIVIDECEKRDWMYTLSLPEHKGVISLKVTSEELSLIVKALSNHGDYIAKQNGYKYAEKYMTLKHKLNSNSTIIDAIYVSEWNNGFELRSKCKVNIDTHEIFNIHTYTDIVDDEGNELRNLNKEYVIVNGKKFCAGRYDADTENWNPNTDYWY